MRPDRIVVGEVRDGAALDMLQAMNTGHDGSLSTVHANTPRDALSRLETMVLMAGVDLPVRAIREQVCSAVDLIVQQARLKDGSRRIVAITEVIGMEGDVITMQDLFLYDFGMGLDARRPLPGHAEVDRPAAAGPGHAGRPRRGRRPRPVRLREVRAMRRRVARRCDGRLLAVVRGPRLPAATWLVLATSTSTQPIRSVDLTVSAEELPSGQRPGPGVRPGRPSTERTPPDGVRDAQPATHHGASRPQVLLVVDTSGSMAGQPMADAKQRDQRVPPPRRRPTSGSV